MQVHAPDPLRIKYRQSLTEVMQRAVVHCKALKDAVAEALVEKKDEAAIRAIAKTELDHLELYNCARYKIAHEITHSWMLAGRPRLIAQLSRHRVVSKHSQVHDHLSRYSRESVVSRELENRLTVPVATLTMEWHLG
ncbi:hypothetical protein [Comamonas sp. MYb69]|uniref:hypothetical protein n=1 Tax=Comamonas sp. MYb69 TaxID=1848650 RepID=UPI00309A1BDB